MSSIKRFEDVHACQEAGKLTQQVYQLVASGPFVHDFGLRDQICRAAVSAMTNIAEGFDCDSKQEFARFLGISRRSAVEVQSLLYVALDVGHIGKEAFEAHYAQATKTKGLIGGFKSSLKPKTSATYHVPRATSNS